MIKNNKGNIPITILIIGTFAVCVSALISFSYVDNNVRSSFSGLAQMEKLNSQIEQNYFYKYDVEKLQEKIKELKSEGLCKCGNNCNTYTNLIIKVCKEENITEPLLFLSLMVEEYQCINNKKVDEESNLRSNAKILLDKFSSFKNGYSFTGCSGREIVYYGWEAALRNYHKQDCNKENYDDDYFVENVMNRYKSLKGIFVEQQETRGRFFHKEKITIFSAEYFGEQK